MRIEARRTAAVALARANQVTISHCRITADELPAALEAADVADLMPLIFLAGYQLRVEHNTINAAHRGLNRNRIDLGGIQIGGRSRDVRIEDNHIEGGNGHGITLGSLRAGTTTERPDRIIHTRPWLTIDEGGCPKLEPGGTIVVPGRTIETAPRSEGPIKGLRIRDNMITDHGGSGISIAHWFVPSESDTINDLDDIEIDEVEIDDNRIYRCLALNLVAALPVDAAFNSGYGGIALASATDTVIHDNEIRDCGGRGRTPICGIYVRYAERLRVTDNRISDNGRPASLIDPLLVGNIGGIVIGHVDGVEEELGSRVREVAAAVITGNTVVTPEGRALELTGSGQMLVQGNTLTSHGNNIGGVILLMLFALLQNNSAIGERITADQVEGQFRAAISQIGGSAVLILNTGINRNLALLAMAASAYLDNRQSLKQVGSSAAPANGLFMQADRSQSNLLVGKGEVDPAVNQSLPRGPVSFSDNMVTFDAISSAFTISLSSIAIISLDDVAMHDNHCAMDLTNDIVFVNALVFGLASCRVVGNRFREIIPLIRGPGGISLPGTVLSAVTLGLLNATEMNQGTYCFLALGFKKPRIIIDEEAEEPRATLDTNRHLLDEDRCEGFLELSSSIGTD